MVNKTPRRSRAYHLRKAPGSSHDVRKGIHMLSHISLRATISISMVFGIVGCALARQSPAVATLPDTVPVANASGYPGGSKSTRSGLQVGRSWMTAAVRGPGRLLYVDNGSSTNTISIYRLFGRDQKPIGTQKPVGQLAVQGGVGMDVDSKGNLWIATQASNSILEYPRGATSPSLTLSDPGYIPFFVKVGQRGTIYVSNYGSTTNGPGNIVIYSKGSTTPTKTLTFPKNSNALGIDVDKTSNVFVSATDLKTGLRYLGVFKLGSGGAYTFEQLRPEFRSGTNPAGATTDNFQGMTLDTVGNLVVASQSSVAIQVFSPPKDPTSPGPWTLTNSFGGTGDVGSVDVAWVTPGKTLVASYLGGSAVVEYSYPSGQTLNEIFPLTYPTYLAVSPPE
jgi:hypothetical protein